MENLFIQFRPEVIFHTAPYKHVPVMQAHPDEADVDVPIVFTGIRPGEKFLETLFAEDEDALPTEHKKIFMVKVDSNLRGKDLSDCLGRLTTLVERGDNSKIVDLLREMVPGYHPMDRE